MAIWPRYPEAEWVPWKYRSPDGRPTYYKGVMSLDNPPIAGVQHITAGGSDIGRIWAPKGHFGASWTYSVNAQTGETMQHLTLEDGGYHAGITDTQAFGHPPTWPLWRGPGINVNHYTYSVECTGRPSKNGRLEWSDAALARLKHLHEWHGDVLGYKLTPARVPAHAEIDVVNRVNDFDVPSERHLFYDYLFGDDDMEIDELRKRVEALERVLGGWGEPNITAQEAIAELDQLEINLNQKVDDLNKAAHGIKSELAGHLENHPSGGGLVPHTHSFSGSTGKANAGIPQPEELA